MMEEIRKKKKRKRKKKREKEKEKKKKEKEKQYLKPDILNGQSIQKKLFWACNIQK